MGGGVDAASQTADDGDAGPGEPCCESFGLAEPVMGGVTGSYDGDRQAVFRAQAAAEEEEAGRIVDFLERGGVGLIVVGQEPHVVITAEIELGVDVEIPVRGRNRPGEFRPDPGDVAEAIHGGGEDFLRRAEPGQQRLPNPRPDARDHGQAEVISQPVVGSDRQWRRLVGHGGPPFLRGECPGRR